jgi:hypothetical protein
VKVDPKTGRNLLTDPHINELKKLVKANLVRPLAPRMEHTFNPEYVWQVADKNGTDRVVYNEDAPVHLLQQRLGLALMACGNRRGADVCHIVASKCNITATEISFHYDYLKRWGDGGHLITYERDYMIPSYRELGAIAEELFKHRRTFVKLADEGKAPYLFLCRHMNGTDLVAKNPRPATFYNWMRELLVAAGLPEFTGYDLLKAYVTDQAKLSKVGVVNMVTRWRAPTVKQRFYVKQGAREWLPRHMRTDPVELESEF